MPQVPVSYTNLYALPKLFLDKYNSLLGYNDYITRMFNLNDRNKLLSLLES